MKTTFGRMFALFAVLCVLCVLLLGISFRVMLLGTMEDNKQETLHNNAEILTNLAAAYDATGELQYRWGDFRIGLTSAAQVGGTEIILCNLDGSVHMCSCEEMGCAHTDLVVDRDLLQKVLDQGEYFTKGTLSGFYAEDQYIEGMAVRSRLTDEEIGVLFITAPGDQIRTMLHQATMIFTYVAGFVLIVALIASYIMSHNRVLSMEVITGAVRRFGRGELDVRVPVGGRNTVDLDELAVAFNTMAESLSQAETQRREFVANVSHELKTPMTTIAGFLDGMLDGTIPENQHAHYMHIVSDEVRRLSRLVRSMLEISRMQAQGIDESKKRRFDLTETIGQVLISFEQRINRKNLMVDVQMPDRSVYTKADPDSITQVVYNLTDNAIKFCNKGGMLRLVLETEGGKCKVRVENTGPTVPPEELPLLFDRFHKTDKSRSEDREGVGLGLYIVKTIINSHGEDISVTSENGVTSFVFTLPLVR